MYGRLLCCCLIVRIIQMRAKVFSFLCSNEVDFNVFSRKVNCSWPFVIRKMCVFTAWGKYLGMGFQLIPKVALVFLRNLKTIPFLLKARKKASMYTAAEGVSWAEGEDLKKKGIRYSKQSGWRGLENSIQDETRLVQEKKKSVISPSPRGKTDTASCFGSIFPSKTLWETKQIWQSWINRRLLFCLGQSVFVPLPWKRQGYLSSPALLQ